MQNTIDNFMDDFMEKRLVPFSYGMSERLIGLSHMRFIINYKSFKEQLKKK